MLALVKPAIYILSDSYVTFTDLAEAVAALEPDAKLPPVMPLTLARAIAAGGEMVAKLTRKPPLIPRGGLHFLSSHAAPDSAKAVEELNWQISPLNEGLEKSLDFFRRKGWL